MLSGKVLLAVCAIGAGLTTPAQAADATVPSGSVVAKFNLSGHELTAQCSFTAVLEPSNQVTYVYGGAAVAYSTVPTSQPQLTSVTCTLRQKSAPSLSATTPPMACPGAACAIASTAGPWGVVPVEICVSAFAVYGPFVMTRSFGPNCS